MRRILLYLFVLITLNLNAQEGTKQLMPNSNDRLWMEFNSFAGNDFGNYEANEKERIHIYMIAGETLHFGMKMNTTENYGGNVITDAGKVRFELRDPNGTVVFAEKNMVTSGNGYIATYTQAITGPNGVILNGTTISGGYNALTYTATTTGNHYIEFDADWDWVNGLTQRFALEYFDVTVTDASNNVVTNPGEPNKSAGRLWSKGWVFTNTSFELYPVNAEFYVFTSDEFINKVSYEMKPFSFSFVANSYGVDSDASLNYIQKAQSQDNDQTTGDISEYRVYLNDPDRSVWTNTTLAPPKVQVWAEDTLIYDYDYYRNPMLDTIEDNFIELEKNRAGCVFESITIFKIEASIDGFVAVLIDIDGNGYSTDGNDRVIYREMKKGLNYILWDFKDDNGIEVPNADYTASATFLGRGPAHFPLYDVESLSSLSTSSVRPFRKLELTNYWDDSQITTWGDDGGAMQETDTVKLVINEEVPRMWSFDDSNTNNNHNGNMNTMNSWFHAIDLGLSSMTLRVQQSDYKCVDGTAPYVGDIYKYDDKNTTMNFENTDFSYKFFDPTDQPFSDIQVLSLPDNGTLYLSGNPIAVDAIIPAANTNLLTYEPDTDWYGKAAFAWRASNGTKWSVNKDSVYLVINTDPVISSIADQTICTNTSLENMPFTIGDDETPSELNVMAYSHNPSLVPNSNIRIGGTGVNRTITVTPKTNTSGFAIIYVKVDDGLSEAIEEFSLYVGPDLGFSGDTTVCVGNDLNLIAQEVGATYEWKYESTTIGTAKTLTIASGGFQEGDYSLTVTKDGCSAIRNFSVAIAPLTTFSGDTDACVGEEISLSATETVADYTWKKGATTVGTSKVLSIPNAQLTDAGNDYTLEVTKEGCNNTSNPFTITVIDEPDQTLTVTGGTVNIGNDGTVSITNSENGVVYDAYINSIQVRTGTGTGANLNLNIASADLSIGDNVVTLTANNGNCEVTMNNSATLHVNVLPIANDDATSVDEDASVNINVLTNDSGLDDGGIIVTITNNPDFGSAIVEGDNTITYTPNANYNGVDNLTYQIEDADGDIDGAVVTITVNSVDDIVDAIDDAFFVAEDGTLNDDVVINDNNLGDGGITTTLVSDVSNGTLTLNLNGTFTYTPDADYNGSDNFTYQLSDTDGDTDDAIVNITVTSVDDVVDAIDDAFSVDEDASLSDNVITNDLNLGDGGIVVSLNTNASNGTLNLNADGTFTYTPAADFNGNDSFIYDIVDSDGDTDNAAVNITVNSVDDVVGAIDDSFSVNEDGSLSGNVITNDLNLGDGGISVSLDSDVSNGTLTLNADGSFLYSPDSDFQGSDTFSYQISDSDGDNDVATVNITVDSVDDVVDAVDDSFSVNEDGSLSDNVITNDLNLGDGGIATSLITDVTNGTLTFNADGSFNYSPDADYYGSDSFEYRLRDTDGDTDDATVTITINSVNDAVNAIDDAFSTDEDNNLSNDVTTNDTDLGDGGITTTLITDVSNGTLILNADGSFSYSPDADFNGSDSFVYELADSDGDTDDATVNITVNSVNDTPVANDDLVSTPQDTDIDVSVLTNDTGLGDGIGNLTVTSGPASGSTTVNVDNTITYSPDGGFSGVNTFTYEICDNDAECAIATVTVTVDNQDDQPVAVDDNATVNEDDAITIDVLANDQDLFDGGLTVSINTNPLNGVAIINVDNTITYTPDANFHGSDLFSYEVCDGDGDCSSANVNMSVTSVNDVVDAVNDAFSVAEDGVLNENVITNDTDLGDGGVSTTLITDVSNGSLILNADGSFSYLPNANYNGPDSFTYELSDANGDTDQAIVSITVTSVNDVVNAISDNFSVTEDGTLNENVITNDSNSGDGGIETTVVAGVNNGKLTLNLDGTFTYIPDADFNGSDSFTYELSDADGDTDNATVTITVTSVNDLVNAVNDAFNVNEDETLNENTITNDTDLGDGGVETTIVVNVSNGTLTLNLDGTFTYLPNTDFNGSDSFTYELSDADGDTDQATVSIDVNSVNDVVDAVNDTYTVNEDDIVNGDVTLNDTDLGDGGIETVVVSGVGNGSLTLNLDGTFTYIPYADFNGSDSFTYELSDADSDIDQATVNITINPVDDIVDAVDDAFSVNEDETLNENVLTNDQDLGDGGISVSLVSDVSNGTLTLNGNGTFSYTPDTDYNGSDSFAYQLSDTDGDVNNATVTINVISVNDVVSAVDDAFTVNEDDTYNGDVISNDQNLGDGNIIATLITDVSNGNLILNSNGDITYVPNTEFNGSDSFVYEIEDDDGDTDQAIVTITVNPVDDIVDAIDDSYSVNEDAIFIDNVITNDLRLGDGGIVVSLDSDVTHGTLALNADGSFTYSPDADYNGSDSFTYQVCDADSDCDIATVSLNIFPVNDVVDAVDDSYTANEDETLNDNVIGNDQNLGDGGLVTTLITDVANGTLTLNADGSFSYTGNQDFNGSDSFVYELEDSNGDTDQATVNITIELVDDIVDAVDDAFAVDEDAVLSDNVLTNDLNLGDGNILTSLITGVSNGNLTLNSNGTFAYTPNSDFNGSDSFVYELEDDDGDIDQATVDITINSVNDTPVAVDDNTGTQQNTTVEISVLTNDGALGDGVKSVAISASPDVSEGTAVVNPSNTITFTPQTGYNGTATFDYTVCDNDDECSIATVEVVVDNTDDQPLAVGDSGSTDEDIAATVDVLGNDGGLFDGGINVSISTNPYHGTVSVNPDNSLTYTPDLDYYGKDITIYEVCDVDGDCSSAELVITVNPINDHIPVAENDSCATSINMPVTSNVLFNDTELEDGELVVTIETNPSTGSAIVVDNEVVFTPKADFLGTETLDYRVCDRDNECDIATLKINVKMVNFVPNTIDDYDTTIVNTDLNVNVLANDTDLDDGIGAVSVYLPPENGAAVVNADYTITYTPDIDFVGDDSLQYKVEDTEGDFDSDLAWLYVSVKPKSNNIPVANNDSRATSINTDAHINVLINDTGLEDGGIKVTINSAPNPAEGSVIVNGSKTVTFTPATDYIGTATFDYKVCDKDGDCDIATVMVNVKENNFKPDAYDDAASTYQNESVNIHVLNNDDGLDDGILNLSIYSGPSNGSVAVNADNTITYTPAKWYIGTDQFEYLIEDVDGDLDVATVTVTITEKPNFVPKAYDDERGATVNTLVNINVLLNDTGLDDGGIAISLLTAPDPAEGFATVNGANNTIDFIPATDFTGDAVFEYKVCDTDGDCDSAHVVIHVKSENYIPVSVNDSVSIWMNDEVNINVLANDYDLDDGLNEVTIFTNPVNGSAVVYGDNTVHYTPSNWFVGEDSLKYMVEDVDGDIDTALVYIEIKALVNNVPVANDDSRGVSKNTDITVDVLFNDVGLEDGGISVSIDNNPINGSVVVNVDNTITYTPNADYTGTDNFEYHVCDMDGDCSGTATVTINVKEVNIIPVAADDNASTYMNTPVIINVLANDTKLYDGIKSLNINTDPTNGSIVINSDNTLTYTPNNWYLGTDQFEYWVEDIDGDYSVATVTVTVTEEPDHIPVAYNDARGTIVNSNITVDVLVNDTGLEDGGIVVALLANPSNGTININADNTIDYMPNKDYLGTDQFDYQVCDADGDCASATVTIKVKENNLVPTAVDDIVNVYMNIGEIIHVLSNDSGLEDGIGNLIIYTDPANGGVVVNGDNTITYTPSMWYVGSDSFQYWIEDVDGDYSIATVYLTITEEPDYIPVAMDDNRGATVNTDVNIDVLMNDIGLDDGGLALTVNSAPSNGSAVVEIDNTITYKPNTDYLGTDQFTYQVCDLDGDCSSAIVTVNVKETNALPLASDDNAATFVNTSVTVDVLTNDSGLEDGGISISEYSSPFYGTVTMNANNTITYTPNNWFKGSDSFEYMVTDADGDYSVAKVTVTVTDKPNYVPVANDDARGTSIETPVTIDVLMNDTGLEDGGIVITVIDNPSNGSFVVNGDNSISYTPDKNYTGPDQFDYQVCDVDGDCDEAKVVITVREDNNVPVAIDDKVFTGIDTDIIVSVLENDSSLEDGGIHISVSTESSNGTLTVNDDNTITYSPNPSFEGADTFSYKVTDVDGDYDIADVVVYVMSGTLPGVTFSGINGNTKEDGTTATFTVVLKTQPTENVNIDLNSDDLTEGILPENRLTFTSSNWDAAQTITITGQDDDVDDGDVPYNIISNLESTDPVYSGIHLKNMSLTNVDNDEAGITLLQGAGKTSENGDSARFVLVLNSEPLEDVNIEVSSNDLTEGMLGIMSIVFTPANWSDTVEVIVTGQDDNEVDGDIAYTVEILASQSDDPKYDDIDFEDISLLNLDNDSKELTIPEAFSPGNDGYNDFFQIVNLEHHDKASIRVYNRWGSLVYSSDNYQNNWDGKSNAGGKVGSELPTGTYYYVLEVSDMRKKINGYVFIKR